MGAVHRHNFEIVRKGYEPDTVDEVILELTIAKNDAEAMVNRLRQQLTQQNERGAGTADKELAVAKAEARRIVEDAHRQADAAVTSARAEAQRIVNQARLESSGIETGAGAGADPAWLVGVAEMFESQLTQIARGALGDVAKVIQDLKTQAASVPAPVEPPSVAEPVAQEPVAPAQPPVSRDTAHTGTGDDDGGTLARLRRMAADRRDAPVEEDFEPLVPADLDDGIEEEAMSLAARIARERGLEPPKTEKVSLSERIQASHSENGEESDRGSFYSRRSARLPRIGDAATASAMASIRSVRQNGEGADSDEDVAV